MYGSIYLDRAYIASVYGDVVFIFVEVIYRDFY